MNCHNHIVLIHGTWANDQIWRQMADEFRCRGFTVHTPVLRHHDLPLEEGALLIGNVGLQDYVDDLCTFVQSLDSVPIIVGHSLGGLLAQLVAARCRHKALVLLAPGPIPPIFGAYPWALRIFARYFLRWGFWRKPLFPPNWKTWEKGIANRQPLIIQREHFSQLCADSGRVYFQMVFWFLDRNHAARLDPKEICAPVLVLCGEDDRTVNPRIARQTAALYRNGRYVELPSCGHLLIVGRYVEAVMCHIDRWLVDVVSHVEHQAYGSSSIDPS
ncbi:MAG: alpha/beta hydrolase [Pseudomonas sp.]|uniref:alpha/beta hydrolase n=1 Tax=Pseudomonas sp. FEMGT703P TaxID=2080764 RepID=UPI000CC869A5|nr:alpha/beta hydrolase [Pseudomonas sp. FEMGT703P]PJE43122.1 MAG: alpha/beta hydrolase [Pseudomonas sp.] [Pseudomonas sp. FEMGT703P]